MHARKRVVECAAGDAEFTGAYAKQQRVGTLSDEMMMKSDSKEPVGFIGLGAMGEPMALNLIRAGTPLVVSNRSREKCRSLVEAGGEVAESVESVLERCAVVIVMLVDGAAIDAVLQRGREAFDRSVRG